MIVYNHVMFKTKFSREITWVLLIKLTLLYCLWNVCFKNTKQVNIKAKFANQIYGESTKGFI